jgi:predicted ATPase
LKINILHISDLHIGDKNWDQEIVLKQFLRDSECTFQNNLKPNLVVVTGDISKSGSRVQFDVFKEKVVNKIKESFTLSDKEFIFCPGNHDVNREELDIVSVQGVKTIDETDTVNKVIESLKSESDALNGLRNFSNFYDSFNYEDSRKKTPLFSTHILNILGKKIGIAALNTAWASSEDKEYGKLLLGQRQVERAFENIKECDVKICAFHHPLPWLKEFDRRDLHYYLASNFDIVLTGHEHESIQYRSDFSNFSCLHIKSGCLYSHRDYPNGYSLLSLDFESNQANLHLRTYFENRKEFGPGENVASNGQISFPLIIGKRHNKIDQLKSKTIDHIQKQMVPELNASLVQAYGDKDLKFKDVFIKPTLCDKSENSINFNKSLNLKTSSALNIEDIIFDDNNYFITGQRESGKTTLLKYFLSESISVNTFSTAKLPVLLNFKTDLKKNKDIYIDAIKKFFKKFKEESFDLEAELVSGNILLLIDDLDLKYPKKSRQLEEFSKKYPKVKIIVSTEEKLLDTLSAGENSLNITFKNAFIHSFKRHHTRDLIKRVCNAETSFEEENILDKVINGLNSCVIPRTPFMISVALSVYQNEKNYKPINKASLIEKFVEILLGKHINTGPFLGLDYRGKEDLLCHVVEYMVKKNEFQIDLNEFEMEIISYLKTIGSEAKAINVINYFLEKRVIIQHEGKIGFNLRCFFEFFAARKMADDDGFYKYIVLEENYLNYTDEIEYYAGLKRNSVNLLETLEVRLLEVVKSLDSNINLSGFESLTIESSLLDTVEKNKLVDTVKGDRKDFEKRDRSLDESSKEVTEKDQLIVKDNKSSGVGPKFWDTLVLYGNVLKHSELLKDESKKNSFTQSFIELFSKCIMGLVLSGEETKRQLAKTMEIEEDHANSKNFVNLFSTLLMCMYISDKFPSPNFKDNYRGVFLHEDSSVIERLVALSLYANVSPEKYLEDSKFLAESVDPESITMEVIVLQLILRNLLAKIPDALEDKALEVVSDFFLIRSKFKGNKSERGQAKDILKKRFRNKTIR